MTPSSHPQAPRGGKGGGGEGEGGVGATPYLKGFGSTFKSYAMLTSFGSGMGD